MKRSYLTRDQEGNKVKRTKYFYGFKMHTSVKAKSGMITGVVCTGDKDRRHDDSANVEDTGKTGNSAKRPAMSPPDRRG